MDYSSNPRSAGDLSVGDYALAMAARGYPVYPCRLNRLADGTKHPTVDSGWRTECSTDPDTIRGWFKPGTAYNAYLIDCESAGIVVADLDRKTQTNKRTGVSLRRDGPSEWARLGGPAAAMVVRTESGGEHHYFAATEEFSGSLGSDRAGIGIDIQGSGKCVFGPGSEVASGGEAVGRYSIVGKAVPRHQLTAVPVGVITRGQRERADARAAERAASRTASPPAGGTMAQRVDELWEELAAAASNGGFNDTLNDVCFAVGRWYATDELGDVEDATGYILARMEADDHMEAADANDMRTIRSSGIRSGLEQPWTPAPEPMGDPAELVAEDERPGPDEAPSNLDDLVEGASPEFVITKPAGFDELPSAVREQVARLLIRQEAERFLSSGTTREPLPSGISLGELLAEPDDEETYLFDGLWPTDGRVFLTAQYKAGKSTTVGNVLRSLVDGDPFLDRFAVSPGRRRVALIDNELSRGMLRRWLRDQAIINVDDVVLYDMRGKVGLFNIQDPTRREEWAAKLRADRVDVVILDCLGPLLASLGLDENADLRPILTPFSELVSQCGATEGMVIHHMGHTGDRGRGHSSQRDWPDAEWLIKRDEDPTKPRSFRASGRDVEVPDTELLYDSQTRHLSLAAPKPVLDAESKAVAATIATLVRFDSLPGSERGHTRTEIARETRARKANVYAALDLFVGEGLLVATGEKADAIVGGAVKEEKYDRLAMSELARIQWLQDPQNLV